MSVSLMSGFFSRSQTSQAILRLIVLPAAIVLCTQKCLAGRPNLIGVSAYTVVRVKA